MSVRISDVRGAMQLATQATAGVTRIVEGVHRSVWDGLGVPGGQTDGKTRGLTGFVYGAIHGINRFAGNTADTVMGGLQTLFESAQSVPSRTPREETFLSVLNGVMGDRLVEDTNPLAVSMTLKYRGAVMDWRAPHTVRGASGKVVLLIHGSCMTDLQQHARQSGYATEPGELLSAALGYSPVYLRYNSGLHISCNGQQLSAQLEQLFEHWPRGVEELSVVAHSMGGLVMRSALHQAQRQGLLWPGRLKNIVFLGTPHHGAPLERAGNWLHALLGAISYTKPFAALAQLRSAGVTDLRYGNLLHEDWHGHGRFDPGPDGRQRVPLPATVNCYTVAATLAEKRSLVSDRLLGDGLVPLRSALGQHDHPSMNLAFAPSSQWIAYRTSHMELLNSPAVNEQILDWLAAKAT